jgi:hypothetical protein
MNQVDERISTSDLANVAKPDHELPPPADSTPALFTTQECNEMKTRWDGIQTGFVDEPRRSVQDADQLVAQAIQRLAQTFSDERARLERQWDHDGNVSTEDLRVAFQRYRAFFQRLLSI